jgi:PAS domain S-box-containing protein
MNYPNKGDWTVRIAESVVLRYGLALVSVAVALGLARVFLYFHLPQPFTAFALSAIAITFWYGGTKPGIVAAVLSLLARSCFFERELSALSHALYGVVYLVFALLMVLVRRERAELEVKVAERTAELTRANEDLSIEIAERKRADEKLRKSEAYLAEAQRLSHMGSWVWRVEGREALHLSEEWYRIYGFDPEAGAPTWDERLQRVHPEDRITWIRAIDKAIAEKSGYDVEFRIVLPNGTKKYIHTVAHPVLSASGDLLKFVGSSTDITERKQAEEALRQAQADLARVNRMTTMGELTASLAHEIKQPIAAAITNANTCVRWLAAETPNIEEARAAAMRIVKDGTRAAQIVSRIRLLFQKETLERELVDLNEVIREMVALLYSEATRYSVSVQTTLAADLPPVMGDRVQLQQVLMNLVLNSIDAMKKANGKRELVINSQPAEDGQLLVTVSDTGVGLPPDRDKIFRAFFTTKRDGTGMGLAISRSIVELHGGRLWAADNSPRGASFSLSLPAAVDGHE